MTTFDLDKDFTASFVPFRTGVGYVAKGTVFLRGKPVEIFEAHGRTLPDTSEAARAKAAEIHKRLAKAKLGRPKKR